MKYQVTARWWNENLSKHFGERDSLHELSAEQIVSFIDSYCFGRAQISESNGVKVLEFQNDYD